jgi:hypothetical protein
MVTDNKTNEIVAQIFNFIDAVGGKSSITVESKHINF